MDEVKGVVLAGKTMGKTNNEEYIVLSGEDIEDIYLYEHSKNEMTISWEELKREIEHKEKYGRLRHWYWRLKRWLGRCF